MSSKLAIEWTTVIPADRQKVWRAITSPEHFANWFGDDLHFERLAVGEAMTFSVGRQQKTGTIATVEPPERYAFYWTPEAGVPARTLVTFNLEAVVDGTLLKVTEEGFDALPEKVRSKRYELHHKGWPYQTEQLAEYVQREEI